MIAIESTVFMQSLLKSETVDAVELMKNGDVDMVTPLQFVEKLALDDETKREQMQQASSNSDDASETTATGKPARKLTRRQLKHREAMVRFRQRKKAKIAVLEEEELKLQQELEDKLREYNRREARRRPSVDDLLGLTDPRIAMRRAFVDAVVQIEGILDENEVLEEAIAVHDKFHATLKRVRERTIEASVWKCV